MRAEPDIEYEENEWGIVYKTFRPGSKEGNYNYREHHLLMPGVSAGGSADRVVEGATGTPASSARWSVPIDDTHTMTIRVGYKPADNKGRFKVHPQESDPFGPWKPIPIEPYKEYKESDTPTLGYDIPPVVTTEDAIVMDSLGAIVDRENEHLGPTIDGGMALVRNMYLKAIETVKAGGDPKGTVRDKSKDQIIVVSAYEKWVTAEERRQMQKTAVG